MESLREAILLLALQVRFELLILEADEFDHFAVDYEALIHANGPRPRVRLRIVDRDVDFEGPERRTPEVLCQLRGVGQRVADDIEPPCVPEPRRVDDKRIAVPSADRIPVPPRLR